MKLIFNSYKIRDIEDVNTISKDKLFFNDSVLKISFWRVGKVTYTLPYKKRFVPLYLINALCLNKPFLSIYKFTEIKELSGYIENIVITEKGVKLKKIYFSN